MALTLNGTDMSRVYLNGTRMEAVNINGTNVYNAANGNVTMVYTGGPNASFSPGAEDANRHFVLVGVRFSGVPIGNAPVPLINGTTPTTIVYFRGTGGGDEGVCGIYTIKIPTGTADIPVSQGGAAFSNVAIYRVTGIFSMETALTASNGGGTYNSSANGCFFGATVQNFGTPPFPTPNSAGLTFTGGSGPVQGRMAASNVTTGPTQAVGLGGNQANCGATFGYDLY